MYVAKKLQSPKIQVTTPKSVMRNKQFRSLKILEGDLLHGIATQNLSIFRQQKSSFKLSVDGFSRLTSIVGYRFVHRPQFDIFERDLGTF